LSSRTPLGVFALAAEEVEPTIGRFFSGTSQSHVINFRVTDSPSARNATYPADGMDYAEGNTLSLPARSTNRLELLVQLVGAIFEEKLVVEVYLAIMDSSQLDALRETSLAEFSEVLLSDMARLSPPDTVYRIRRGAAESERSVALPPLEGG
jgi:hypothetical protein